jgi:MFS family permease
MLKKIFGLIGGMLLLFILDSFSFPYNYSYTFFAAFIIMSVSLLFFSLNQNLPKTLNKNEEHSINSISSIISVLKNDTEFLFLCLAFIFSAMLFSIIPFFSLYAKDKFDILDISGGIFTVIFFLGQTVGSIIGGHLGNKHDYKKTMVLSIVFGMVTIFFVMFSKNAIMYFTSFFFVGFSLSARKLSFLTYTMSAATKGKTPIYVAITNNITMPFQILFPLLAGLIVEYISYNALFLLCLSFLVLSVFSLSL